jgi:predicted amidohydrolase
MQFHAIQHDIVQGDFKATRVRIENQIERVNPSNGDFVVLQEMTDTGWSMKLDEITGIGTVDWACTVANQFGIWLQVGWADCVDGRGKNCVTICSPNGKAIATYSKVQTCNPLHESKVYDCGDELLIINLGLLTICPMICYDVRFPELWRLAAVAGVDVFTISSSWPLPRIQHWRSLLIARAIENQAFVVASNRVGKDDLATWGGLSMLISPLGEVLVEASETAETAVTTTINQEIAHNWRKEFPAMEDVKPELLGNIKVRHISA